jgi:hypothetical protein
MGRLKHAFKVPGFFKSFGWQGWPEDFFHFSFVPNMFLQLLNGSPSSAQWVPNFPMCSRRVFLIAHCFNPICFAQSPPLLTYIGAPKGTSSFNRIFYFGGASKASILFF